MWAWWWYRVLTRLQRQNNLQSSSWRCRRRGMWQLLAPLRSVSGWVNEEWQLWSWWVSKMEIKQKWYWCIRVFLFFNFLTYFCLEIGRKWDVDGRFPMTLDWNTTLNGSLWQVFSPLGKFMVKGRESVGEWVEIFDSARTWPRWILSSGWQRCVLLDTIFWGSIGVQYKSHLRWLQQKQFECVNYSERCFNKTCRQLAKWLFGLFQLGDISKFD